MQNFDIPDFFTTFSDLTHALGFERHLILDGEILPMTAFVRENSTSLPWMYISAGIHGDEPAGVLACHELLKSSPLDNINLVIIPILNPWGCLNNVRENADGFDLNRDYATQLSEEVKAHVAWLKKFDKRFIQTIGLHEDSSARGFYVMELLDQSLHSNAYDVVEAARKIIPYDTANRIDGIYAENGVIHQHRSSRLIFQDGLPEHFFLYDHYTSRAVITETPSTLSLEKRVAAQVAALRSSLSFLD